DQIQFRAEVETLAVTMGLPAETSDVLELYHAVVTGVADATKTLERRQDAEAALLAERDEACELAGQLAQVQAQAQRMMDVFK
ncbi:hypothetical protein, partial [Enterococcus faecalis]|uniref:hypothetical protein n=1 Tax=Enterococcus faecalis TaxID=1351 RepID=UPI003D6BD83D